MNTKYFNKNTPSFRKPKTLLGAHVKDAQEVGNCRGVDDIYLSALAKLMGIPSCITTIQSLKWMGLRESTKWGGGEGRDSAEIVFQTFMQKAIASSSGTSMDVHSLMVSTQHFLCRPRRRPPSKIPWRMVWERVSWCVTCPSHTRFTTYHHR